MAGGEGQRLRRFLRYVHGTERPKQFCAIIGRRSMLRHTLDRAESLIPSERTVTVVTAGHRPFVAEDLVGVPPRILVEQPRNRDTGPGILLRSSSSSGTIRRHGWSCSPRTTLSSRKVGS